MIFGLSYIRFLSLRQELKDAEARRQAEEKRLQQEQIRIAKIAPWSHSSCTLGMSLTEIQKAEREKRAQDAAIELQKLQVCVSILLIDILLTLLSPELETLMSGKFDEDISKFGQ